MNLVYQISAPLLEEKNKKTQMNECRNIMNADASIRSMKGVTEWLNEQRKIM